MSHFESRWLGLAPYNNSLQLQNQLQKLVGHGGVNHIIGCEHLSVVTLGKRADESEIVADESVIKEKGIEVCNIERGGEATMHSPGQLVVYPIVNLKNLGIGVRQYLNILMETTSDVLKSYGIVTSISGQPGLYTSDGKIAFFGVRVNQGITSHGLALNVSNDLELFSNIRSCGVDSERFDSLRRRGVDASCRDVFVLWVESFYKRLPRSTELPFQSQPEPLEAD